MRHFESLHTHQHKDLPTVPGLVLDDVPDQGPIGKLDIMLFRLVEQLVPDSEIAGKETAKFHNYHSNQYRGLSQANVDAGGRAPEATGYAHIRFQI
jgi:hypothetical protein